MKVFIPYGKKQNSRQTFEVSRLRKTLKRECEISGIEWVDNVVREPQIAHLISMEEEKTIVDMHWRKIPVIVSAFYCESEPRGAFLDSRAKGEVALKPKAVKFLNRADLVLVPSDVMRNLCLSSGVKTPIRIHETSINLARFNDNAIEQDIFPRYFGIRPNERIVLATGEYGDHHSIRLFQEIASLCPELEFYFFGSTKRLPSSLPIFALQSNAPKNLHFQSLVQDDIFRSALLRADAYLTLNSRKTDSVSLLEAFAAKTQVIAMEDHPYEPLIKDGATAWVATSVEQVANCLKALTKGEKESTVSCAYEVAKQRAIERSALKLKRIYQKLLYEHA